MTSFTWIKDGPVCHLLKEAIKEALEHLSSVSRAALIMAATQILLGHFTLRDI